MVSDMIDVFWYRHTKVFIKRFHVVWWDTASGIVHKTPTNHTWLFEIQASCMFIQDTLCARLPPFITFGLHRLLVGSHNFLLDFHQYEECFSKTHSVHSAPKLGLWWLSFYTSPMIVLGKGKRQSTQSKFFGPSALSEFWKNNFHVCLTLGCHRHAIMSTWHRQEKIMPMLT